MYALTARLPCLEKKDVWEVESQWILPVLGVDEVLVKNSYVALNPYDWKAIKYRFALKEEKTVMGRDGSGIVWRTGSEVERLKRGDRVSQFLQCTVSFLLMASIGSRRYGFAPTAHDHMRLLFRNFQSTTPMRLGNCQTTYQRFKQPPLVRDYSQQAWCSSNPWVCR